MAQTSNVPTRKVGSGGASGALVTIIIFIAAQFGLEIPGEVGAAAALLVMFIVAYFVPEKETYHEEF